MLTVYTDAAGQKEPRGSNVFWVDLRNPTTDEIAQVAADYGVVVPSRESLQEIETSRRLRVVGQVLYVSMPLAIEDEDAGFAPVPLGFVLSPERLITVRYVEVSAFNWVAARVEQKQDMGNARVFCALIEGMVDFGADQLERLSGELAQVSARAFGRET